jgi:Ser/Thr protein kinase RdoA (MazF antagonist)
MNEETVRRILTVYGVRPVRFFDIEKGYRNENHPFITDDGQRLNLIIYKREPEILKRIQRANRVADALAAQGFPARQTYDARLIQLRAGTAIKYAGLYAYLPGQTIPWEAYTMAHIKQLGKTMGDMHQLMHGLSADDLPSVADEYLTITRRMQHYFSEPTVRQAMKTKLDITITPDLFDSYLRLLKNCQQLPNQQVLHMDFVRGNILFDSSGSQPAISGVLDFEKVAVGHPLFDIARTYAFLLVDCKYKTPAKVRKYFLQSGYGKHSRSPFALNDHNERLLRRLTGLFLLYDFYKFLRHNPYESLHQNEHYRRTRELLPIPNIVAIT